MVSFGADRLGEFAPILQGRVALLTGPSGRTGDNRSTIAALAQCCDLRLLLAPEHGVRGDKAAGALVDDDTDPESGLTVHSLYRADAKGLTPELLTRFDTLVYDMADVGCRYYTFISTLYQCLQACAGAGKRLVVLDRPNPLGDRVEGVLLEPDCASFVGCYRLPVCYGLTCGELADMMNREQRLGCDLRVAPCLGLTREMTFRDWGRYWVMPSLAMPRFETALLYPGTCLLEGTNLSEGRGTADPFAILGAPFIRSESFCAAFNALGCPGVTATPTYFTPTASKHQGQVCGGIHLHITDEAALEPVALGLRLLDLLRRRYPESFQLLPPVRPGGKPFLSLLAGHRGLEDPDWALEPMLERCRRDAAEFRRRKAAFERYPKEEIT